MPWVPVNTSIQFLRGAKQLDHNHRELEFADCIALTFERQKKDKKMNTVTLMCSQEACLCPVRAVAAIVRTIWKYHSTSQDSPISTSTVTIVHPHDKCVDSHNGRYRRGKTGHKNEDVGTQPIRLGTAMAMYLGECPVFMIMLIGHWSSNATPSFGTSESR